MRWQCVDVRRYGPPTLYSKFAEFLYRMIVLRLAGATRSGAGVQCVPKKGFEQLHTASFRRFIMWREYEHQKSKIACTHDETFTSLFFNGGCASHPFPFCIPTHSALQEETAQRICNNNIRCRENFGQETAAAKHEPLLPSLLRG